MDAFDPKKLYNLEEYQEPKSAVQQDIDLANEKDEKLRQFLQNIEMIESSGGKNFDHKELNSGIHKGQSAAGSYGLMPNTIKEIINRKIAAGQADDELKGLLKKKPDQLKAAVETNPELELRLARSLGERVLERQGDPRMAAYSWMYGHNLTPEQIKKRNFEQDPYVQKYDMYNKTKNLIVGNEDE